MTTGLIAHRACFDHVVPPGHPECAARLNAVLTALDSEEFAELNRIEAPRASRESLLAVHDSAVVDAVLSARIEPGRFARIDADTAMSPGSAEAALRAVGAVAAAVDGVMANRFGNGFCAVRPPGHHAERARSMGFLSVQQCRPGRLACPPGARSRADRCCRFPMCITATAPRTFSSTIPIFSTPRPMNSRSIPAPEARRRAAWREMSSMRRCRRAPAAKLFRAALTLRILPALVSFSPQFLFISAGFDAHRSDPLASLQLEESDFAWATEQLCEVAAQTCGRRVVSVLEGGYDLDALARSAAAHVRALMAGAEARP